MINKKSISFIGLALVLLFSWTSCDPGLTTTGSETPNDISITKSWIPGPGKEIVITAEPTVLMSQRGATEGNVGLALSGDGNNLLLTFNTGNMKQISKIQAWVGTDPNDVPKTRRNIPIPGKFPYKVSIINSPTHTLSIPTDNLGPLQDGQTYYVFAHVEFKDGSSAWAGSTKWESRRWAYYFSFLVGVTGPSDPPPADPATAFAVGNITFKSLEFSALGWVQTVAPDGTNSSGQLPLYAGATNYNLDNGTLVGYLDFEAGFIIDGTGNYTSSGIGNFGIKVTYTMLQGYGLDTTNLYAGASQLTVSDPADFGNTHENLGNAGSDSYLISFTTYSTLYISAHAVVNKLP
jgi:hypothetical protein